MDSKSNPKTLWKLIKIPLALLSALGLVWVFFQAALAGDPAREATANMSTARLAFAEPALPVGSLRLVSEDEEGMTLEMVLPEWQVEIAQSESDPCQLIRLEGYSEAGEPGSPRLPGYGKMLGVPAESQPNLELLESEWAFAPGHFDLCPEKTPQFETSPDGERAFTGYALERNPAVYGADSFWPSSPVELLPGGFIRSQRVVALRFQPFQYNPARRELRYTSRLLVRLHFNQPDGRSNRATQQGGVDEGSFEATFQSALLNYQTARAWRVTQPNTDLQLPVRDGLQRPAMKILVNQDGLYQVTYDDLLAAGLSTDILDNLDPKTFLLYNNYNEVDILVQGEADGKFDSKDYLLFYGKKVNTKWTNTNVYWLFWGEEFGQRMDEMDGAPDSGFAIPDSFTHTQRLEENLLYRSYYPNGPDMERWYWVFMVRSAPSVVRSVFTFMLEQVADQPFNANLRGALESINGLPQHHTKVYVNRHLVVDDIWPDDGEDHFNDLFSQSYLISGTNKITVEIPVDAGISYDSIFVNWFEIDYARNFTVSNDRLEFTGEAGEWEFQASGFSTETLQAYDISDPAHPKWVSGMDIQEAAGKYDLKFEHSQASDHSYLVLSQDGWRSPEDIVPEISSSLLSPQNGADYLIISHAKFITEMQELADWREDQGLRTKVIDVQDIYDEVSGGVLDPAAIRTFLMYAYQDWLEKPAPSYVVLAGDGHYDLKNYKGYNIPEYIPPYLADADKYLLKETAANNSYVSINSADDFLPDMHLGLLSMRTAAAAQIIVDKLKSYDQNVPVDDWNQQVMFIADDYDPSAGDFRDSSEDIIDHHLPDYYTPERIYYTSPPYYTTTIDTPSKAQQAIVNGFNDGRLIVSFIGHAWKNRWAQVAISNHMFHTNMISSLNNEDRLPFALPMTCYDGYYFDDVIAGDEYLAMAEGLQREEGKGAIASFSPTGLGVANGHDVLERAVFDAIFIDYLTQIGPATTQAKLDLYAQTGNSFRDLIETYLLFGDPATNLHVVRPNVQVTKRGELGGEFPDHSITYTLQYTNTSIALATHVVISDVLPVMLENAAYSFSGSAVTVRPGSPFIWDVADLEQGQGGLITITANVMHAYHGELKNEVEITSPGDIATMLDNRDAWLENIFSYWLALPLVAR